MTREALNNYKLLQPGTDWWKWACGECEATNVIHQISRAQAYAQKHHEQEHQ